MSWQKKIGSTVLVLGAILVLLLSTIYVAVHTRAFNRFALGKMVEEAEAATGARVDIGRMDIHWSKLGVDFYDFVLYGTGGVSQPPVFEATHLRIGLKIVSIFKRKVDLSEVIVDQPVLDLRFNARGESNLPKSRTPSKSNPVDTVFNLAVGHVLINAGQLDYNDEQIPLSADLSGFHTDAAFGILTGSYKGTLGYNRGRIVAKSFNPIEHGLELNFSASRSELDIDPLTFTTGSSRIAAHIKLLNYENPSIQGSYEAVLLTQELGEILKQSSLPVGQVAVKGTLRYQNDPKESFVESTYVDGRVESSQLRLRGGQVSADARAVNGSFVLEKGNLRVSGLEADLLQGHLNANGEILNLAGRPSTNLSLTLNGVSLEAVSSVLPAGSYDRVHFTGRANVNAEARWTGSVRNIVAHTNITIVPPSQTPTGADTIPLSGAIDGRYDGAKDVASFGQSHLQTGATQISLTGTLSKQSDLAIQVDTSDLHELSALISEVRAATAKSSQGKAASKPFDIRGAARFAGQATGSVKNPKLQGQLTASDLRAEGGHWRSLQVNVDLSPNGIALQNGSLVSAQQGQVTFRAQAALHDWSFKPSNSISADVHASNINIADAERLGELQYPVTGNLSASVMLQGTEQNPSAHGSVQIAKASAWDEPINSLGISFQGSGEKFESTAQLRLPAGEISADAGFSLHSGQYQVSVNTSGLKLEQIHTLTAHDIGAAGLLTLSASGSGTLKDPALSAHLQIAQFKLRGQSISEAQAQLSLAHQHVDFTLHSVVAQGNVEAKGDVQLGGGYETTASADVRALPIGSLLASYVSGSEPQLQGQAEIHAELSGPLKDPARLQAHLEVPTFNLAYGSANIALAHPLRLDYREGVATLQQTEFKGTGTDLTLKGVLPVRTTAAAFNIAANGNVDLSLLQTMTKEVKSSGRVELAFTARGDLKSPQMQGHLQVVNAYFSSESLPVGIEGVNGLINVSGNRVEISQLSGSVGGGTVSAQGTMIYSAHSRFNLGLRANSVRVRYPEGLRSILNCNLQLNGSASDSTLSGRVAVDRLSFTQQFDLADFIGQFTGPSVAATPGAFEQNMKLSIAIQSASDLNLVNSQLSMQGSANLNLTGTMANPVILGRMTLTGGDIFFLGKRYEVQNGTIEFSNPVQTQPVVNLYVKTTVDSYDITLRFNGPVDQLRTTYTSDPPLASADIINLLALGQTAEESATSNTPASVGAESVLASGAASQVSGKIQRLTGLSQLTIDPMAGNNQANPGAQVAIQQRVTGNILLTFSTDVTSTQATTVQLQYRTSRQTSVIVLRDQNGGYAIDLRLHKTF